MKKIYLSPVTETVNVKLYGSVLGGMDVNQNSPVTPVVDAKENNLLFEDEGDFGDIWASENEDPNDLWGDN